MFYKNNIHSCFYSLTTGLRTLVQSTNKLEQSACRKVDLELNRNTLLFGPCQICPLKNNAFNTRGDRQAASYSIVTGSYLDYVSSA